MRGAEVWYICRQQHRIDRLWQLLRSGFTFTRYAYGARSLYGIAHQSVLLFAGLALTKPQSMFPGVPHTNDAQSEAGL